MPTNKNSRSAAAPPPAAKAPAHEAPREAHAAPAPALLTASEVASLLRVHPKQIYRLLRQGLPGLRVGGEWRFDRAEVLGWASQRPPAAPAADEAAAASAQPPPLVAANGDVVIHLLLRSLPAQAPLAGFVQADRGSGLEMLRGRRVLATGVHGEKPPPRLGGERLVLLYLVEREVGLIFARGARVRKPSDVAALRVATRPPTAGVRQILDAWLATAGLAARVGRGATEHASHEEVVLAVARGEAEVGVTTSAWAQRLGLGFLPLATEPYALAMAAASVGSPVGVALCEAAQGKALRERLAAAGGYATANTGLLRFEEE